MHLETGHRYILQCNPHDQLTVCKYKMNQSTLFSNYYIDFNISTLFSNINILLGVQMLRFMPEHIIIESHDHFNNVNFMYINIFYYNNIMHT